MKPAPAKTQTVSGYTRRSPAKPSRPAEFYSTTAALARGCGWKFRVKAGRKVH